MNPFFSFKLFTPLSKKFITSQVGGTLGVGYIIETKKWVALPFPLPFPFPIPSLHWFPVFCNLFLFWRKSFSIIECNFVIKTPPPPPNLDLFCADFKTKSKKSTKNPSTTRTNKKWRDCWHETRIKWHYSPNTYYHPDIKWVKWRNTFQQAKPSQEHTHNLDSNLDWLMGEGQTDYTCRCGNRRWL